MAGINLYCHLTWTFIVSSDSEPFQNADLKLSRLTIIEAAKLAVLAGAHGFNFLLKYMQNFWPPNVIFVGHITFVRRSVSNGGSLEVVKLGSLHSSTEKLRHLGNSMKESAWTTTAYGRVINIREQAMHV